ncbi:MAG TPA: metallophosphoesterase [Longimicrobiaceae bacterium]|nr:metallophosphoesterase [Longimicrobiaceae bacterium]
MSLDGDLEIELCGERLVLLPERAAYRPRARALLVADPHFGKAAAFRALGVPVPGGTTAETLARLAAAVERTGAEAVVFLGDVLHAKQGRAAKTLEALAAWRRAHPRLELTLVRGNHDAGRRRSWRSPAWTGRWTRRRTRTRTIRSPRPRATCWRATCIPR